jgi:hypothetical protein
LLDVHSVSFFVDNINVFLRCFGAMSVTLFQVGSF